MVGDHLILTMSCHYQFRLVRDPRANYQQTLKVLQHAKTTIPGLVTKSSIMLGMGETDAEVLQTLKGTAVLTSTRYNLMKCFGFHRFTDSWCRLCNTWSIYATNQKTFEGSNTV